MLDAECYLGTIVDRWGAVSDDGQYTKELMQIQPEEDLCLVPSGNAPPPAFEPFWADASAEGTGTNVEAYDGEPTYHVGRRIIFIIRNEWGVGDWCSSFAPTQIIYHPYLTPYLEQSDGMVLHGGGDIVTIVDKTIIPMTALSDAIRNIVRHTDPEMAAMDLALGCAGELRPFYGAICAQIERVAEPDCGGACGPPGCTCDADPGDGVLRRRYDDGSIRCFDAETGVEVACPA